MKRFFVGIFKFSGLLVLLAVLFAAGFATRHYGLVEGQFSPPVILTKNELIEVLDKELSPEIIELSHRVGDNTRSQMMTRHDVLRTHHYLSGHDHKHPFDFCPECGLLDSFEKRMETIDVQMQDIATSIDGLDKSSPEHQEGVKKQVALETERRLLQTYLFNTSEMEQKISNVVKATKFTEDGRATWDMPKDYGKQLYQQLEGKDTNYLKEPVLPVRTKEEMEVIRRINAMNDYYYGQGKKEGGNE